MAGRVMSYVYCLFFFSWHWLFSKSQLQILYWITQNNLLIKLFALKILISFIVFQFITALLYKI